MNNKPKRLTDVEPNTAMVNDIKSQVNSSRKRKASAIHDNSPISEADEEVKTPEGDNFRFMLVLRANAGTPRKQPVLALQFRGSASWHSSVPHFGYDVPASSVQVFGHLT